MPASWTQNYYHMVFGTKHREPWISVEVHERLYAFIGGILRDLRAQLLTGNGMPDHVHLLVRFPPDLAPAVAAREVKARSSRWIHETFKNHGAFSWQKGYGGFTVSTSVVAATESYIRSQAEHHKKVSFEDEFVAMLEKNGIPFDRRYLFD
jgi:REP element-mobilizing transposase RayT